jgi:PIN domain nuclease of toxin-antitoxin system
VKVLDASAVVAFFLGEPGADIVRTALPSGRLSVVNLCEVLTRIARDGVAPQLVLEHVKATGVSFVDVTAKQALHAANLRDRPGLSLGDRFCVALAQELSVPALTSDRLWAKLSLPVAVELIR